MVLVGFAEVDLKCVHLQENMRNYRKCSKTSKTPRRPFEKERIDAEMKLVGEYGRISGARRG